MQYCKERRLSVPSVMHDIFCTVRFLTYKFNINELEFTQVSNFNKPSREISKTRCLIVSRIYYMYKLNQLDYTHTDVAIHYLMTDKINVNAIYVFLCNILIY